MNPIRQTLTRSSALALMITSFAAAPAPVAHAQSSSGPDGPPPIEFTVRGRFIANADLGSRGANVSSVSFGFSTTVPVPIAGRLQGSLALDADFFQFSFHQFQAFLPGRTSPINHGKIIGLSPSIVYLLGEKVILFAGPQWQFSGADRASTNRATQWSGSAGAVYQARKGLVLVGGVAVAGRIGYSAQVVPYAGFDWTVNPAWSLAVTGNAADYVAPVLKVTRKIDAKWSAFALVGLEERYIRLKENSSIAGGTLRYEAGSTQVGFEWRPKPSFSATLYAGAQLAQKYTFKDRSRREVVHESVGTSPSFGFKLQQRY